MLQGARSGDCQGHLDNHIRFIAITTDKPKPTVVYNFVCHHLSACYLGRHFAISNGLIVVLKFQIKDLLDRLVSNFPEDSLALDSPISVDTEQQFVKTAETVTGFDIPDEIRDLLRWHDGQSLNGKSLFPCYRHLVDSSRIIDIQNQGVNLLYDLDLHQAVRNDARQLHDIRVRNDRYWQNGWFPFAEGSGKTLLIDLEPSDAGKHGQVILWDHFGPIGIVVGYDFKDFLDRTITAIAGQSIGLPGFFGNTRHWND